jgi:hypothetical protein
MSDLFNQNKTKYVIDTSTFIQMDRMYPKDIFQSLWLNLENSLNNSTIISHQEVYNELLNKLDDLSKWTKERKQCFYQHDFIEESKIITKIGEKYENFIIKPKEFYADPWIIAQAKVKSLKIITEEKISGNKERIPKIAKELFGFECLSLFDLMRKEGWVF